MRQYGYIPGGQGGANQVSAINGFAYGGFSGINQTSTYDDYSEVKSVKELINGTYYTTCYDYDDYGNKVKTTYPSGLQIQNVYDVSTGYLTSINDYTNDVVLYTPITMNCYRQATSYSTGNGKTSSLTTNYGIPTYYGTPGVQALSLAYDWASGDLLTRQDYEVSPNLETFTYDTKDRLESQQFNTDAPIYFDYASNGNITDKPDVGTYDYGSSKINAVTGVSNSEGNISNNTQNISYIGFNKAAVITENGYELDYNYAADYSRKYSVLKHSGTTINTRVYSGSYEVNDDQTENPQQLHYIYGNNGLIAIIVKDITSGYSHYYTYTDQIGSILEVTDNTGTIIAEQNFDAWGRNRGTDLSYTDVPSVPNWLYRGFTGHEMLPQFGLINMNGRMYDPLLGRVLSPDNNVSDESSTQAYNRYSYCLNNPLKYNDPSGWEATYSGDSPEYEYNPGLASENSLYIAPGTDQPGPNIINIQPDVAIQPNNPNVQAEVVCNNDGSTTAYISITTTAVNGDGVSVTVSFDMVYTTSANGSTTTLNSMNVESTPTTTSVASATGGAGIGGLFGPGGGDGTTNPLGTIGPTDWSGKYTTNAAYSIVASSEDAHSTDPSLEVNTNPFAHFLNMDLSFFPAIGASIERWVGSGMELPDVLKNLFDMGAEIKNSNVDGVNLPNGPSGTTGALPPIYTIDSGQFPYPGGDGYPGGVRHLAVINIDSGNNQYGMQPIYDYWQDSLPTKQ